MENNLKDNVEKIFTEKQVVYILVDAIMISKGDEWVPQEDDDFKSFLDSYHLLETFDNEYGE